MQSETKICKNCKLEFTIVPEDFEFYAKVAVPPPTWCPSCRMQRRMAWRNERAIYRRTCDLCQASIIGMYPALTKFPVYCHSCWWSDKFDPMVYGREYDPNKSFFEQWKDLQNVLPRPEHNNSGNIINSAYTNCAADMKDCYLVFGAQNDEGCMYSHYLNQSKDCLDVLYGSVSEKCYDCFDIERCYSIQYSQSSRNCRDSFFLYDCRNCSDCIGCVGLRNKQFHIFNIPYTKEEYERKKAEFRLDSRRGVESLREKFLSSELYATYPRRLLNGQLNKASTGDYINESENALNCFYAKGLRGCKYVFWAQNMKDSYDYFAFADTDELAYERVSGGYGDYNCKFTEGSWISNYDLEYCGLCYNSKSLFGCIGLRKKEFCILNKQYSAEEYRALTAQIRAQMMAKPYVDEQQREYCYGEFFPLPLSPFPYWDTVAQEHFPLTKEEVLEKGYNWREPIVRSYTVTKEWKDLPSSIAEVPDEIVKETISCEHAVPPVGGCAEQCTVAFRITPAELAFYREMNIPLPTLCYQCRHASRVKTRNPLKLWGRTCAKCSAPIKTSYAPERPEIVYCESCYNAEVA